MARRPTEPQDKHIECDLGAALKCQRACREGATRHAAVQLEIDLLLPVLILFVKKDLRELDLAAQKFLGEVWTVVWTILVGAEDRHIAIKATLAQGECRCVACASTTHDHDSIYGHVILRQYAEPDASSRADLVTHAVHPEDRARMQNAWADFCAKPSESQFQFRVVAGNDVVRRCLETVVPLGESGGYVGTISDVTDLDALRDRLQGVEESLQHKRDLLNTVIEEIPALVFWKDLDGKVLGCNKQFAARMGLEQPSEVIGKRVEQFQIGQDLQSRAAASDSRIIETGIAEYNVAFNIEGSDGNVVYLMVSKVPLRDSAGKISGIAGVMVDITPVAVAHQNLVHLQLRYDLALAGSGVGVWDWTRSTRSTYLSACWKELLGYTDAEVNNSLGAWIELVHPADRPGTLATVRNYLRGRCESLAFEQRLRHKDGSYRSFMVRGRATERKSGSIADRIVGTIADITDLKRDEAAAASTRRLEAIGQLAAGIAHEINTPCQFVGDNLRFLSDGFRDLGGIIDSIRTQTTVDSALGPLEVAALLESGDYQFLSEECPKALQQSVDGVERITKIVRAMKELAHPGEDLVATDLNRVITTAVVVATSAWRYVADVETDLDPNLPTVMATASELHQVILNLVVNAAHAITAAAEGGATGKGVIRISTRHDSTAVELRVADTGSGIPEEIRARIFDPFFTTKPLGKGTGQGLAIVQKVIEKHQGSIEVTSEVGTGTTFRILLPCEDKKHDSSTTDH